MPAKRASKRKSIRVSVEGDIVVVEVEGLRVELSSGQAKGLGYRLRREGLSIQSDVRRRKREEAERAARLEADRRTAGFGHALAVLGLSWPCTAGEVKAAYRRLALASHPDRGGSAEGFRQVREAYERVAGAIIPRDGAFR
jgi:hypothetical protein